VDAVLETAGPDGTVLMPVMTFGEPFDPAHSPSRCGLITETFRRRPDAVRSLSPTHSIAGIGADAITASLRARPRVALRPQRSRFPPRASRR
jgi:aminoglycoside 3-N-acetyltransferase